MASSSSPSLSPSPKSSSVSDNADKEGQQELQGKIRGHEVAISELEHLQPSRNSMMKFIFRRNSSKNNVHPSGIPEEWQYLFSRSIKTAIASEQKQLDLAKARLQKLNAI